MVINGIDYLFHYTTLEKLALILQNKTIRLNQLTNMDDLQEKRTKDLQNIGRFIYVSSWTDEEHESIAMWTQYTKMDSGVRIALPKNPFLRKGTKREDLQKVLPGYLNGPEFIDTFLDLAELIKIHAFSVQAWKGDILSKVLYTDDIELLEPNIISTDGHQINLALGRLGKYKNRYWEHQKEWRYMMTFIPFLVSDNIDEMEPLFSLVTTRIAKDVEDAPFAFFDLPIRLDAFSSMIITSSPQMTLGNQVILEALVNQYNPDAQIINSELLGLL